ncbi:MAG: PTS ascorbate transporter subunit IIC [Clostridiales bacterium]|nr:PTS ascorbate transporter subunit IIC [Clostridiales bacterium]
MTGANEKNTARSAVTNSGAEPKDTKKQIPLRLSSKLYAELAAWAEDEFRSVNGQIEYLLTECVSKRRRGGRNE